MRCCWREQETPAGALLTLLIRPQEGFMLVWEWMKLAGVLLIKTANECFLSSCVCHLSTVAPPWSEYTFKRTKQYLSHLYFVVWWPLATISRIYGIFQWVVLRSTYLAINVILILKITYLIQRRGKSTLKFKRKCFCFCLLPNLEWSAAVLFQDQIFSNGGVFFGGGVVFKMQESTRKPQAQDLNGGDIHPCHWTESL